MSGVKQTFYIKDKNYKKLEKLAESNNIKMGPLLNYIIENIDEMKVKTVVNISFKEE